MIAAAVIAAFGVIYANDRPPALGKQVAPAAAIAITAEAYEFDGRIEAFLWLRRRLRTH